jgi:chromosome segregation ATPase
MEELFRLNRLSEKALLLKVAMKDTKTSLEIKQTHNEQLEKEHTRHNELLGGAKERVDVWVVRNDIEIREAKKNLKEYDKHDIDGQLKLFNDAKEQQGEVVSLSTIINELSTKINKHEYTLRATESEMKVLMEQEAGIQDKVDAWNNDHAANIQAHEEAKSGLATVEVLTEQQKLHDTFDELSVQIFNLESGERDVTNEIAVTQKRLDGNEKELVHLQDAKCPYCLQQYESAEDKIAECTANIERDNTTIVLLSEGLDSFKVDILKAQDELNSVAFAKTLTQDDINTETKLRADLFKKIAELKAMVNPHSIDDAKELENRIQRLDSEIEALDLKLSDLVGDKDNTQIDKDKASAVVNDITKKIVFDSLEALYKVKGEAEHISAKLEDLQNGTNPHLESYNELKAVKLEPIDMETINQLDKLMTHQNYLLKLLTKKDSFIRKNLLNKNLVFLNQRLRGYLSDLGLPHRVEFTQEMTAHISQFGRQLDFGNLSSGQKARVNLALSFSFRDVLQRSLDSVNVCMLDEVLDVGLDSVGVQNAAHMLKRKSREDELTLFIISHRDEVSGIFDKTLTVTMEKGFSSISQAA